MGMTRFPRCYASVPRLTAGWFLAFGAIAALVLGPPRAWAQDYWQAPSGDWSNAANWSAGLPGTYTVAEVDNDGTVTITQTGEYFQYLYLGDTTGSGTVQMTSGAINPSIYTYCPCEYVGYAGTGSFVQSGGSNQLGIPSAMYVGYNPGALGTYNLSGSGLLTADAEYVGNLGTGVFIQTGGTNQVGTTWNGGSLSIGYSSGTSGSYSLSGTGVCIVDGTLSIGYAGSNSFSLSQSAQLSAWDEYVGYSSGPPASFQQTGGSNAAGVLSIAVSGSYVLSGGTLSIANSGGLANQGVLDFTNSQATLLVGSNCIVDLSQANLTSAGSMTVSVAAGSLLILPAGFDPTKGFGTYHNSGTTHVGGTTLTVAAGQTLCLSGSINDPVNCQGTISGASILNLNNGLTLSGTGVASLSAAGTLTTDASPSAISGGSLSAGYEYVGRSASGSFTQSGGTNQVSVGNNNGILYLGFNAGSSGTYTLTGGSLGLPTASAYLGYSGTGTFNQSGGTNQVGNYLYLGYNSGSSGSYTLSGTGLLSSMEYVGYSGSGAVTQSGGTNQVVGGGILYLGFNAGSSGSYNFSGSGLLSVNAALVGCSGAGSFTQSGGTIQIPTISIIYNGVYLGYSGGASGDYSLSGSALLSAPAEYVGCSSTGDFTQTGGTNTVGTLALAYSSRGIGTYSLDGPSLLSATNESVGSSGLGIFTQSGGTNTVSGTLALGSSGKYTLTGTGTLSAAGTVRVGNGRFEWLTGTSTLSTPTLTLGSSSTLAMGFNFDMGALTSGALFHGSTLNGLSSATLEIADGATATQAGTVTATVGTLNLGTTAGSGNYNLGGSAAITATNEYVASSSSAATARFQQSGGTNSVTYLSIGSGGQYQFSGGALQINGGVFNAGVFDGSNAPGTLSANCLLNLASGTWQNLGSMSVSMGAQSLLIVPAGFDPSTGFGSYTSLGLVHTAGTTFNVPAGVNYSWVGSINDPVDCQGTLTTSTSEFLNLNNGLMLSGTGVASLGNGSLVVNDSTSNMTSGSLSGSNHIVGLSGAGTFTQSGGTNAATNLYLGYNSGDSGTYLFSGTGSLQATSVYVGYSGTGNFTQSGGTNQPTGGLWLSLGCNPGSSGTYSLGGMGQLTASGEDVGFSGAGTFTQSSGTNTVYQVYLGWNPGGSGTFILSSGQLALPGFPQEGIGWSGTGTFIQTGGTNAQPGFAISSPNSSNLFIFLGYNASGSGTYSLSGSGLMCVFEEDSGYSGTGAFNQSGGTNVVAYLNLGNRSGSTGAYNLSGTGQLSLSEGYDTETVGCSGTGIFTQSGGISTVPNLILGLNPGSSGTYNLTGGTLILGSLSSGSGAAAFNFGGGTIQPYVSTSTTMPMTLTGSGGNATVDTAGYTVTLAGPLSGPGGLTKTDSGTLVLTAANTYSGPTMVNAGTLRLGPPALIHLPMNGSGSVSTATGAIPDSSGNGFNATMNGSGATFVPGRFGQGINTNGGMLQVPASPSFDGLFQWTDSVWINVSNTANFGSGVLVSTRDGDGDYAFVECYDGAHVYLRDVTYSSGGWMQPTEDPTSPSAWRDTVTLGTGAWHMITTSVSSAGWAIYVDGSLGASGTISGEFPEMVATGSTGSLWIGNRPGYTAMSGVSFDDFQLFPAVLTAAQVQSLYATGSPGASANLPGGTSLQIARGATFDMGGVSQTVALLSDGAGGGTVTNGGGGSVVLTLTPTGGAATTFSGVIQDGAGQVALTLNGNGTQVLAGSNTYTGGTTIAAGILQFSANSAVPSNGTITIDSGAALALAPTGTYSTVTGWLTSGKINAASAGAVALIANSSETISMGNYASLSLGASGNVTYSGTLTPNGTTYNLGGGGGTLTFTTTMTGARSLNVCGPGSVLLIGSNSYTGGTTISSGTLQLGDGVSRNGSVAGNITNNAQLTFANPNAQTYSGSISGSGGLTKTDAGALVLAGSNIYSGGTTVDGGILEAANGSNGSATGSGSVTLNGGTLASGTSGGSISGGVQAGSGASTIAPGGVGSIGPLTIGSLVTASNLTLNFDLTTPGDSGDQLTITNGLTVAQNTAITFGANPTTDGDYRLIGVPGSFDTSTLGCLDLPNAPSNRTYSLSTSVDPGYIDLVVVPEPSTLVLLGVAAIGLLGYVWRWRKRT